MAKPVKNIPEPGPGRRSSPWRDIAICAALGLAILLVYGQTAHFDFVNYDDPEYVTDNAHVQAGLSPATIKWAFTAIVSANWSPVTIVSHILTTQVFGLDSGAHHLVNVLFHALAAMLLFVCLRRATGAYWPSAFVAWVFAVHPLHVESVAWVSERKDVLCAFFWFLALYAYIRYTERPGLRRYLTVVAFFVLGLMSKPMMVTFPFALWLFDFWPLRRAQFPKVIVEKLPLIALSAAASIGTWLAQHGAVQDALPLAFRLRNAAFAYLWYVAKLVWPSGLTVFYMYRNIPVLEALAAAALIVGLTFVAFLVRRNYPYLLVGWLWYLGTLVPVIGLIQVGGQAMADRYTYIPAVGLCIMIAWGCAEVSLKRPQWKPAIVTLAVVSCILPMAAAYNQVGYWISSEVLFRHAIDVSRENYVAKLNLGTFLGRTGRGAEAIPLFEDVVRQIPGDPNVHNSLGILLADQPGRLPEAIAHFTAAVRLDPGYFEAHYNLATELAQIPGREAEAIAQFEAAQKLAPRPEIAQKIRELRAR